jgi:hypothetical protein
VRGSYTATACVLLSALAIGGCGGDDTSDTNGGLAADELAALLPDAGIPQAAAVDVVAAKEAAGLPEDADPIVLGDTPEENRFAFSTFFAMRHLSVVTDNPVRRALDHSLITAYAAHPFVADEAVTLVSTSQSFEDIADALEEDGWEREGDVLSTEGDPEALGYTAVAAGDGHLVLGYSSDGVSAVATGSAEPSESGELKALENLDAPVVTAVLPESPPSPECVSLVTFEDFVDGTSEVHLTVDGASKATPDRLNPTLAKDLPSIGFDFKSAEAAGDTLTIKLSGLKDGTLVNSPALFVATALDGEGPVLYDCS